MPSRRWMTPITVAGTLALVALFVMARSGAPTAANQLNRIALVAAGGDHTCALSQAGAVECWGANTYGELGDGTTGNRFKPAPVLDLSSGVAAIAAGSNHTCALLTTGGVKCWGYNRYGQLGNGTATGAETANPEPVDVSGLQSGVIAITAGGAHTCALLQTGGVKCWGWNRRGQIGDGQDCSTSQCRRLVPTDVTGLASGVVAIDAGIYHTCAVLATGAVKCWGQNDLGQVGAATGSPCLNEQLAPLACAPVPVDVPGLSGVTAVAAGYGHTCALLASGGVKCWGDNSSGQLGDGGACGNDCGSPVDVSGLPAARAIAAGSQHTCALTRVASCWGDNEHGQLGNGDSPNDAFTPVAVCAEASCASICIPETTCGPLSGASAIALGTNHSCAEVGGDQLKCWGDNSAGQVGDSQGCGTSCDTPVNVLQVKGALPDLVVTTMRVELETGGSCAFTSTALGVRVEFANTGHTDAGTFVVEVNGVQQTYSAGLRAGATGSLWFQGYPLAGASTAVVDATSLVVESDEANNSLTASLPVPTLPPTCTATPTATPATPTRTPTPTPHAGDANCDGNVNSIDAALVLQYSAGLIASLHCQGAADANHDGSVNSIDAALVLQYVAGLLGSL
jgi:alpha-tubulin suppressor-like RCC1 family protein